MEKGNPGVAAVLSFIFTGLGQIYNGQIAKGLIIMAVSFLVLMMMLVGVVFLVTYILGGFSDTGKFTLGCVLFVAGTIPVIILGIYNIYDAYNYAQKKSNI